MTRLGACLVPEKPAADWRSYVHLRDDFGISIARVTPGLDVLCPEPGRLEADITRGHLYAFANANISNYLNPSNAPAHASGGLPAYQPGISGAAAWWLYTQARLSEKQIRDIFAAARAVREPSFDDLQEVVKSAIPGINKTFSWHFADSYLKEQSRTWARDHPLAATGQHAYGAAGFEEADALSGARDWMLKPDTIPHIDAKWSEWIGREIGKAFPRSLVQYHGIGNEFGNDMCWLPIRFDGANFKGGEDTVATYAMPDYVLPYYDGLLSVQPDAVRIGGEHDGTDIMRRFLSYELANGIVLSDFISFHPYPTSEPRRVGDYLAMVEQFPSQRGVIISEIAGPEFADWLDKVLIRWPFIFAICALQQEWESWYKDWWAGGAGLELTEKGKDVQKVIRLHQNSKRRAAGGK